MSDNDWKRRTPVSSSFPYVSQSRLSTRPSHPHLLVYHITPIQKKKKKTKEKRKKLLDKSLFFYFHESQDSQWRAKEDRPVQSLRGLCQLYRYYLKFSFIQILETCLENICKIIYTVICTENERNNQRTPITKNYKVSFISSISFNINCELNWIEKN